MISELEELLARLAVGPLEPGAVRALFAPTFHALTCITLRGGELELVWRQGDELGVVTAACPRAELPPWPEGDVDLAARDGILLFAEAEGRVLRATSPGARDAPAHHAFFAAILALASRHVTGPGATVLADLARYLR